MTLTMQTTKRALSQSFCFIIFLHILMLMRSVLVQAMCPRMCTCDDNDLRVICTSEAPSSRLKFIPHTLNPRLRELILRENNIKGIQSSLEVYGSLRVLDMSNNNIRTLKVNDFEKNEKMEVLMLNKNEIVSVMNNSFKGLKSLRKLGLSENAIERLEAFAFKHLVGLEWLDLSKNTINSISTSAFDGLSQLRSLNLRSNRLSHIPSWTFLDIPHIRFLDLGENDFSNISSNAFMSLNVLEELCLDGCELVSISDDAFSGLTMLSILRLQNNNLEEIPSHEFSELNRLEVLQIGGNNFSTIPASAFSKLQMLKSLQINDGYNLSTIKHGAFDGLSSLAHLEITHNHLLSYIHHTIFEVLPKLQYLNLRGNALKTFQTKNIMSHMSEDTSNLIIIDVRDNPLTCNCSLNEMREYLLKATNYSQYNNLMLPSLPPHYVSHQNTSSMIESNNPFSSLNLIMSISQVYCDSPHLLYNKLLIDLHSDDLGCFELNNNLAIMTAIMIGILLVSGVLIIFIIRSLYKLAGIVKSQWFSEGSRASNTLRNDLDYSKPDFVIIHNFNELTIEEYQTATALEVPLRCPLKITPITDL